MKKFGFTHRALALVLVLVMVLQVLPMGVLAAEGDFNTGDTGIVNSTLGKGGTINWPIKIYDYLNDGMLFENAGANLTSDSAVTAVYGGGQPQPVMPTYGIAFATGAALPGSYNGWGEGEYFTRTVKDAAAFTSPRYVRITRNKYDPVTYYNTTLTNFGTAVAASTIRYITIVYRSKGIETASTPAATIQFNAGGQGWFNVKQNAAGTWTNSPDTWQYLVVDLVGEGISSSAAIGSLYLRVADTLQSGDYLDIAYIACYKTEFEAKQFGIDATTFCNEPGEYLKVARPIDLSGNGDTSEVTGNSYPYAGAPSYRFTTKHVYNTLYTYFTHGNGDSTKAEAYQTNIYHGLNFTMSPANTYEYFSAYNTTTYKSWTQSGFRTTIESTLYSQGLLTSQLDVTEKEQTSQGQKYVNIKNISSNTEENRILLMNFREDYGDGMAATTTAHQNVVLIYRTHNLVSSDDFFGFWAYGGANYNATTNYVLAGVADATDWQKAANTTALKFGASTLQSNTPLSGSFFDTNDQWVYQIVNFADAIRQSDAADMDAITYVKHVGLYLPALTGNKSIDLAYVGFFGDNRLTQAKEFAVQAVAYMNSNLIFDDAGNQIGTNSGTSSGSTSASTITLRAGRGWNAADNQGFGLLHAAQGPDWASDVDGFGGTNSDPSNGYYSYKIGYDTTRISTHIANTYRMPFGDSSKYLDAAYTGTADNTPNTPTSGKSNYIYYVNAYNPSYPNSPYSKDGDSDIYTYTTNHLAFDGYELLTSVTAGNMTLGMLENTLVDGRPVYRQETVEYLAELLYYTLTIPPFDADGDYNYNFLKGGTSSMFALDLNGNGTVGDKVDLNGDGYAETDEAKMDLATALRYCLGVQFTIGTNRGVYTRGTTGTDSGYGDYAATVAKAQSLIGTFANCRGNIRTCMDAAYFLLNNIFVENSYNQLQTDYGYLVLSHATLDSGKTAYVFDAGYTTGDTDYTTEGTVVSSSASYDSVSALQYSSFKDGNGTISMGTVGSKDMFYFQGSHTTTRFPFLPVTNSTGDFAGETKSYYFIDDGIMGVTELGETYVNRNYNYVMQANGEFLFDVEDNLFFEFEGDDDVYLFINNELVLDIGAAHSIANVAFNMNDYVTKANDTLTAKFSTYSADMSDEEFEALLTGLTDAEKAEYRRWHKLNLQDGQTYAIDFYYMERHGYGANCRIVTNIIMSDPTLQTEKTAYQNGEEVAYGGVVTTDTPVEYSFSMTNAGNSKLYKLSFNDPTIGVTMDWENGLTLDETKYNANKILNGSNGKLTAQDLVFTITGYKDEAKSEAYDPITVKGLTNDQLKAFLYDLATPGNETQFGEGSTLFSGSGLWRHATITVRGFYYKLDSTDTDSNNVVKNTVYIHASPATDSETVIKGETNHLVRVMADAIQFYQWAGNEIGIHRDYIFSQLSTAVKTTLGGIATSGGFFMESCKANGASYNWPNVTVTEPTEKASVTGMQGTLCLVNYKTPGKYTFYLKLWNSGKNTAADAGDNWLIQPVNIYVTDVEDDTIVLDYGLPVDLTADGGIYANDDLTPSTDSRYKVMGIQKNEDPSYQTYGWSATSGAYGSYQLYNDNRIMFSHNETVDNKTALYRGGGTVGKGSDGKFILNSDGSLTFKPIGFMDEKLTIWAAITVYDKDATPSAVGPANTGTSLTGGRISSPAYTINIANEVQMFQKITVMPATVVYYEDDFIFNNGIQYTNTPTFEKISTGSGSLTQSVDQDTPYGQDAAYQNATEYSGNSLAKIEITDTSVQATFAFQGTGLELISRTNAFDSSTIIVEILETTVDSSSGTKVYSSGTGDYNGDGVNNYRKIPVITEFDNAPAGGVDAIYQVPVIRIKDLTYGRYTVKISGNPAYDFTNLTDGKPTMKPTCLYIDGIRIYQPMKASNGSYLATENGATFTEMRDLVANGQAAVATFTDSLTVSSGTLTWTEDLKNTYTGNAVTSSNDYLITGPNNELYMDGSVTNSAVALYVQEDADVSAHSMQIAVRALDYSMFLASGTNALNAQIQYGVKSGSGYTWKNLTTVTSGTEQYYTIPYSECPYVSIGNSEYAYQVVLRATQVDKAIPVLVSYTSLKTVGLELKTVTGSGEPSIMKYSDGILLKPDYFLYGKINGATVASTSDEYKLLNGALTLTVKAGDSIAVKREVVDYGQVQIVDGEKVPVTETVLYMATSSEQSGTTVTMTDAGTVKLSFTAAGTYTFSVKQSADDSLTLSYAAVEGGDDTNSASEAKATYANLYSLSAQMSADASTDVEDSVEITPIVEGVSYDEAFAQDQMRYFSYTPTVSGCYYFRSYGNKDTYAELYDENFNLLLSNEDGTDNNFVLKYELEAGKTYIFGVAEHDAGEENWVTFMLVHDHYWSEGVCDICGKSENGVTVPTMGITGATLNFESEIMYNIYFTADQMDDVVEMGLITFDTKLTEGTIDDAVTVVTGYYQSGSEYVVHTNGIPAKNLGDAVYFKVYAKLSDGTYAYSDVSGYNAVLYAQEILANSTNEEMKDLVVAMLNYGAAAQTHFGYKTDSLMNAVLTDDQKASINGYSADMVEGLTAADSTKLGDFTGNGGFASLSPNVAFEGAFAINFYMTPANAMDGDLTFYYWRLDDYTAADVLTADNASGVVTAAATSDGEYLAVVEGIAAKEIDQTVYISAVYESEGVRYCTGVIAYSLASYCQEMISAGTATMQAFAAESVVYGYYAKQYFA